MERYLSHQNLQQYMGSIVNVDSKPISIVSEMLSGPTLKEYLQENGRNLPFATKFSLIQEMALTLAFLHTNDVYFRIFSPDRIRVFKFHSPFSYVHVSFLDVGFGH